jgi:hypothetical protein
MAAGPLGQTMAYFALQNDPAFTVPSECRVTINFELNWDLFYIICNDAEWCVSIISARARAHACVMLVTFVSTDSAFQLLFSTSRPRGPYSQSHQRVTITLLIHLLATHWQALPNSIPT